MFPTMEAAEAAWNAYFGLVDVPNELNVGGGNDFAHQIAGPAVEIPPANVLLTSQTSTMSETVPVPARYSATSPFNEPCSPPSVVDHVSHVETVRQHMEPIPEATQSWFLFTVLVVVFAVLFGCYISK